MRSRMCLFLLIILVCGVSISGAQDENTDSVEDEPHPLLEMMAFVPDTQVNRDNVIAYADIRATERTRGMSLQSMAVATELMSFEEFKNTVPWYRVIVSLLTLRPFSNYMYEHAADVEVAMGFRSIDMNRTLYFGFHQALGQVIQGNFDRGLIDDAMTKRDYAIMEETDGIVVWCPEGDCTQGFEENPENFNGGNIFGGNAGHEEPLALVNDFVVSSRDNDVFRSIINASQNESVSLVDDPAYATIVNQIIVQDGLLRQVLFIPAYYVVAIDPETVIPPTVPPDRAEYYRERFFDDFQELPAYDLIAITDVATPDAELTHIYLPYDDRATAEAMKTQLQSDLRAMLSLQTRTSWHQVLQGRNLNFLSTEVIEDNTTGKFTTVITFSNPLPSDADDADTDEEMSGLGFSTFWFAARSGDLLWLATQRREVTDN